ncbi:hypothetical protein CAPTEDRAFT_209003 [Capitella teleta]|uniref:Uncharacterized protein n=1 Tax=Capitella teleta TaxID=283909 RepID=R7V5N8_CAPTE|nr:hypothetical protein CAPTEDRAFT_209003 [Capitella teleta]|eukprot:ELU11656.1 hypothetical protein CAPTEDRAFT_209003 [Capitella teleta]
MSMLTFRDHTEINIKSCVTQNDADVVLLDLDGDEWTMLDKLLEEDGISRINQIVLVANFDHLYINASSELFTERQRSIEKFEVKGFIRWKTMPCTPIASFKSPLTGSSRKKCYTIVFLNRRFISL